LTPTFAIADPVIKEIYYQKKTSLAYPATYTFRFSLWDAEVGGNEVWFEEKPLKLTSNLIKTYLGDIEPLDSVDFSLQYWVQVDRKKKDGTYVPVGVRQTLGVVPYALFSTSGVPGVEGPVGPQGPQGATGPTTICRIDPESHDKFYEDFWVEPANWYKLGTVVFGGENGIVSVYGDEGKYNSLIASFNTEGRGDNMFWANRNPTVKMRQAQLGSDPSSGTRYFGLVDINWWQNDGIYFKHTVNGNYIGVCVRGGEASTLDTGVAASDLSFHTFKIVVTGTCSAEFFVDGVSKGMITRNIPYQRGLNFAASMSNKTASNGLCLDYVHVVQDR